MTEHVAVSIVNYKGWQDSIACLESVFRTSDVSISVVLVDNGSDDDSLQRVREWTEGRSFLSSEIRDWARRMIEPGVPKPIETEWVTAVDLASRAPHHLPRLTVIASDENLGFAAANNLAIRLALRDPRISHVWLLNNDTLVEPLALSALVRRSRERPDAGQCGSTVLFYDRPDRVQAFGGARYFKRLGLAMHIGRFVGHRRWLSPRVVESQMDYVSGVSILATRKFIEMVGTLSEDYFLYYEELDWALRGRPDFALAFAPDSIVYHKGGASIGSHRDARRRSLLSDYYLQRNRLRVTRRFFPRELAGVRAIMFAQALVRYLSLHARGAETILGALFANESEVKATGAAASVEVEPCRERDGVH